MGARVSFVAREAPLEPVAMIAAGAAAQALARRLLDESDAALAQRRAVAAGDAIVVLGDGPALPWVDGARYLGRDPDAPHLLVPTESRPNAPLDAFEAAILRRARGARPPLAVSIAPRLIVSVAGAAPIERASLASWLAAGST